MINELHEVKIETGYSPGLTTKIFVDGVQIKGVQALSYTVNKDAMPEITVKFITCKLKLDGKCKVNLEDDTEYFCPLEENVKS